MQPKDHHVSQRLFEAALILTREAALSKSAEARFAADVRTLYALLNDDERDAALLQFRAKSWVREAKC